MPDPHPLARDKLLNDLSSSLSPGPQPGIEPPPPPPPIPDHELFRCVGRGSYGEVWLARSVMGPWRAVKIVYRRSFDHDRPYERELEGIRRFEPVSRTHPSQLNVLHVGRNDTAGCFYYVMELADDVGDAHATGGTSSASPHSPSEPTGKSALRSAGFPTGESQLPSEPTGKSALRSAGFPTGELKLPSEPTGKSALQPETYTPRTLRSELLQRGRLPFEECLSLGLALATALDHLHRHGLVHRDIKPSNIIFVNGIPKLADIGLVAAAEATLSVVGTEGYLPPEGPGTPQADIFSLGKVLYEMATGRDRQEYPELPTNLIEQPAAERAQLAELNEIIIRACHADLKQRYQTAAELHADLAMLQSGKSVSRMRTVERRLKFVARAGAGVTVIALLAGLAFFYQQIQTREARRLASENKALAEAKTQLADEKTKLADENRARLVRLDIANGVRLMDADDFSGALLWFAAALPLLTNNPAEEAIHRIRIQQVLSQSPRLLKAMPHDANVASGAFSPDGRRVATGTAKGDLRIWDAESGATVVGPLHLGKRIRDLRFTKEGARLLARSCDDQGKANKAPETDGFAVVLNAATGRPVFPGVSNAVRTAFSPDDRLLAVARTSFVIEVLDAMNGRVVVELSGHTNEITMLSFTPDGSLLASASTDQTVRLWRLPSGESVSHPLRHPEAVLRAVFSPDARRLATATEAPIGGKWCFIRTWEVATGTEIGLAMQVAKPVFALAFDPANSRRLITGDHDRWISVLDADSHIAVLPPLKFEASMARCWAFSPDGRRFAAGSDDSTARVWDLETGMPLTPSLRHVGWVESVSFSPDSRRLLTTSDDATLKIWDLGILSETAKPLQPDASIEWPAISVDKYPHALSSDGRRLLLAAEDLTLRLVNLKTFRQQGTPMPTPNADLVGVITFDASGRQWAAALGVDIGNGRSRSVGLWREEGGGVRYLELQHPKAVEVVQFSVDGSRLVTWSGDSRLRTWQTSDGKLLDEQKLPDIYASMETLSTDGTRAVMTRKEDRLPELLDLSKPGAIGVPLALASTINMAAFSPEGDRVAAVGHDQHGHIWNAHTGQALTPPFKHGGSLYWIEWSPDGRRVLTAGAHGAVMVWDAATGEPAAARMDLSYEPLRVAHFSPDGRFVVARNDDQLVRVWDSATSEPVTPVLKHAGAVRAVMITKDNRLVTVSTPAVIRAWNLTETSLSPDVLEDYAKLVSCRRLNAQGVLLPLKPGELAELSRSLRARAPQLFE